MPSFLFRQLTSAGAVGRVNDRRRELKIDSSTIGMESARNYKATGTTVRRFRIMDYRQELSPGNNAAGNAGDAEDGMKEEGTKEEGVQKNTATLQDWQTRLQATASRVPVRSSVSRTYEDIRQQTVRYIFDLLFSARKNRLSQWMEERGITSQDAGAVQGESGAAGASDGPLYYQNGFLVMQPTAIATSVKVLSFEQETYFEETEDTSFSTVGTVKTADGREISFNVNVGMSRSFQEYYQEELNQASFTFCDPLVINLDTDMAQLEDQTFYFDIDGDGEKDEISELGAGSGYLALDKNEDGVINDGKELFGTESGNGFADLAKYDEDGNGWIDENDAVWDKLKIWTRDENGKDVLYTLAEKGVGAVCLQNAATDFTQRGGGGQTLGAVRNTGVFLYENGNVGTVQHLDVAKYEKQA